MGQALVPFTCWRTAKRRAEQEETKDQNHDTGSSTSNNGDLSSRTASQSDENKRNSGKSAKTTALDPSSSTKIKRLYHDRPLLVLDLDETLVCCTQVKHSFLEELLVCGESYVYLRPHVQGFLEFCFHHFDVAVWTAACSRYGRLVVENLFWRRGFFPLFLFTQERCTQVVYFHPRALALYLPPTDNVSQPQSNTASAPRWQYPLSTLPTDTSSSPAQTLPCIDSSSATADRSSATTSVLASTEEQQPQQHPSRGYAILYVKDLRKVRRRMWNGKRYRRSRILVIDDNPATYVRNYGNAVPVDPFYGDPDDHDLILLQAFLSCMLYTTADWTRLEKRNWKVSQLQLLFDALGADNSSTRHSVSLCFTPATTASAI